MTTRFFPGLVLLVGIAIALTGCPNGVVEDDDDVRVDQAQVEEYRSDMDSRLNQVDSDISTLEQRRAQVDAADDDDADRNGDVQNLRDDLQDVRSRLQEPASDDFGDWTNHRNSILSDVYDLERRLDRKLTEAAQTGEEIQSTARERMQRMDQRRQTVAQHYREYRGTEQRQQDRPQQPQAQQDQAQQDQAQQDRQRQDRPQWEQNYEDARQDAEERVAEIPQLGLDDLDDARGDIAGNLTDMRSALESGEQDVYDARDERHRERGDRHDNDYDGDANGTAAADDQDDDGQVQTVAVEEDGDLEDQEDMEDQEATSY